MIIIHPDTKTGAAIAQAMDTPAQKIKALSERMRFDLDRMDIRFRLDIKSRSFTIIHCRGVVTNSMSHVWILDACGNWHEVKANHIYAEAILFSVNEKLNELLTK